jgi:hypothetical protein
VAARLEHAGQWVARAWARDALLEAEPVLEPKAQRVQELERRALRQQEQAGPEEHLAPPQASVARTAQRPADALQEHEPLEHVLQALQAWRLPEDEQREHAAQQERAVRPRERGQQGREEQTDALPERARREPELSAAARRAWGALAREAARPAVPRNPSAGVAPCRRRREEWNWSAFSSRLRQSQGEGQ